MVVQGWTKGGNGMTAMYAGFFEGNENVPVVCGDGYTIM